MQDLRSLPNGGGGASSGRFFGDRRLRPYPNQALKCPRCDSLNTKFCYYNNYNLSQPRHFCKNCRRYWTKGGVLRNVPVGGGCRKAKRSKPKSSISSDRKEKKEASNSSSESSSLTTAAAAATTTTVTTPANDAAASSSSVPPSMIDFSDSRLFVDQTPPSFDMDNLDQSSDCGIFPESGSFTSLMNVGNSFHFSEIYHQQQQQQHQHQPDMELQEKMQELAGGCIDPTVGIDLRGGANGELTALDWQTNQGLFDLPNTVDQSYWSQSQWAETDQHLYLP